MKALVGTAKGLIVYQLASPNPELLNIFFEGFNVTMVYSDPRNGRWWVGVSHKHWGQKLHYSDDEGVSWHEAKVPGYEGKSLPNGKPAKLRQIWCMHHGGYDRPDHIWMGTEPGGLFLSTDGGKEFHLVEGLWDHPSRQNEMHWFGTGGDFPFIHSIIVDTRNSDHVFIAVSCAGVFRTTDGGKTWNPRNKGLIAAYLPNPHVEVGHDPHCMLMSPSNPDVLWQQNHCGIYYSKNSGENWTVVSEKNE